MGFQYPLGTSGISVNGRDLRQFSCKLQTAYSLGAAKVETETFQGAGRSSVLLLGQRFGLLELVLPLEFWGSSRRDTVEKWSGFCREISGPVALDLGDGFLYACAVTDLGEPAWITDEWMAVDVTFQGLRQKPAVTISAETTLGASIFCSSTYPRTDCVITLPGATLQGASSVSVQLGDGSWYLPYSFTASTELVLDGVNKAFLLNGANINAGMNWEDFPYLVPGENPIGVFVDGFGITQGVEITYRPTFL